MGMLCDITRRFHGDSTSLSCFYKLKRIARRIAEKISQSELPRGITLESGKYEKNILAKLFEDVWRRKITSRELLTENISSNTR